MLASLGATLLCYLQIIEWGWRLLYAFGCLTAVFAFLMRRNVVIATHPQQGLSLTQTFQLFWNYRKQLLLIILVSGLGYANYVIALVLMNGLVPLVSPLAKEQMIALNSYLLVLDFAALPLFGWLASKV